MKLPSQNSSAEIIPLHPFNNDKTHPRTKTDIELYPISPPANWTFFARLACFILLEAGFIALCAICLSNPYVLSISTEALSETKAVVVLLSIIWQTLAIMLIQGVVTQVFSGEWHDCAERSGRLDPSTDKISRLTADIWDRISYFCIGNASSTYRIAFLVWMLSLALSGLAPGSISVGTVFVDRDETMDVARINPNHTLYFGLEYYPQRSTFITRMEQVEGATFKYPTQKNWVIPAPGGDSLLGRDSSSGQIRYATDLIHFDYTCAWESPKAPSGDYGYLSAGGSNWYRETSAFQSSLLIRDIDTKLNGIVFLSLGDTNTDDGRMAFLFLGSNTIISSPDNFTYALNLDNLPTTPTAPLFPEGYTTPVGSPLASVLLCDPHYKVSGGYAILNTDGSLAVSSSEDARVNNINDTVVNRVFTMSLLDAITDMEPLRTVPDSINSLTASLFLSNFAFQKTTPLSAEEITRNMNAYVLSATKAFTDGYSPITSGYSFAGTFETSPTSSLVQVQKLALVTNRNVFYITVGLVCAIGALVPFMVWGWMRLKNYPLGLSTLLSDAALGYSHPIEMKPLHVADCGVVPADWTFPMRLVMFMISEGVFLALAGLSYKNPLILDTISVGALSESKSGATVLFIFWQNITLALVQGIVIQIFCGEWYAQLSPRGSSTVYTSIDKVSKLSTDITDHISHIVSPCATHTYRAAFVVWMISIALSSFAPGSMNIAPVLVDKSDSSFKIAGVNPNHTWSQGLEYYPRRATSLVRMEQWENTTFRYQVPPKTIIPTPSADYSTQKDMKGDIRYNTDIIQYDYSCGFVAPGKIFNDTTDWYVSADGTDWKLMLGGFEALLINLPDGGGVGMNGSVIPLYNQTMAKSAYLFLAYPEGEFKNHETPFTVDNLPHSNTTEMFSPIKTSLPSLASVLVCDPRYTITGADILLDTNQTLTIISGNERVNNVHDSSANVLFSLSLTDALTQMEPKRESFSINTLTGLLFFNDGQPLSSDYISGQMNMFIHSAAKAFTDGYRPTDGKSSFGAFEAAQTPAVLRVERLGVVTNKWFFFVSIGLTVVVSILAMTMFIGWRRLKGYPLCIASVNEKLAPNVSGNS
ncbi:hypothetical protein BDQ17DRAFT_817853 [Cyathus striatus]|nr:hypothetical protein BDQ17DRAFT_817853 [Cyathus striatus]